jgi:hypothetical protein
MGKVFQQVNMNLQTVRWSPDGLPRPAHDLYENSEIHWGIRFRTSLFDTVRPWSAARMPRSIAAAVSQAHFDFYLVARRLAYHHGR